MMQQSKWRPSDTPSPPSITFWITTTVLCCDDWPQNDASDCCQSDYFGVLLIG